MKFKAMITFMHNSVMIYCGDIVDSEVVKFSNNDINFLRSQNKIMLLKSDYIKEEIKKAEMIKEEFKKEENVVEIKEKNDIEEYIPSITKKEIKKEINEEFTEKVDEEVVEEVKNNDFVQMKRADLIKLAISKNIPNAFKMSKVQLVEKLNELNNYN